MKILFLLALALMCPGDDSDSLVSEEGRDRSSEVVPVQGISLNFEQILQRMRRKTNSFEVSEVLGEEEQNHDLIEPGLEETLINVQFKKSGGTSNFEKLHRRMPSMIGLSDVRA